MRKQKQWRDIAPSWYQRYVWSFLSISIIGAVSFLFFEDQRPLLIKACIILLLIFAIVNAYLGIVLKIFPTFGYTYVKGRLAQIFGLSFLLLFIYGVLRLVML